jgi:hypothetical protein
MFLFLLTYEQVSPSILDNIVTFGDREDAADTCLSQYCHDDTVGLSARYPAIVALGRSGLEIREILLLRGVERTTSKIQWSIRQMAIYLSFDIVTGKTLLIAVKGNDLMQQRIAEESADILAAKAGHEDPVVGLFEMFLQIFLSHIRWCEEGWRWFIRDVEKDIGPTLVKSRTAPIHIPPSAPRLEPAPPLGLHIWPTPPTNPFVTPAATGVFEKRNVVNHPHRDGWLTRACRGILHYLASKLLHGHASKQKVEEVGGLVPPPSEMFNYKDLQKLYVSGQNIEQAILALHLLISCLQGSAERYQDLIEHGWDNVDRTGWIMLDEERILGFKTATRPFLRRLRDSIRSLEAKRDQLLSLQKRLQEGKALVSVNANLFILRIPD